jgi:transposase
LAISTKESKEISTMSTRIKKRKKPRTVNGNYSQNWPQYNLGQTTEKVLFPPTLQMLCEYVVDPLSSGPGRPSAGYKEKVFCVVIKAFESDSARRCTADLTIAAERGLISNVPHFNTLLNYARDEQLAEILEQLIIRSSFPLRNHEKGIAIDSTSFSTDQYISWRQVKFGKSEDWHDWRKLHIACGVDTHIITAALTSAAYANDYNFLRGLLRTTGESGFEILEVYADKAYLGGENIRAIAMLGAIPFVPPKARTSAEGKSTTWKQMYSLYDNDREEFDSHYHQRSNVETVFSMMKAVFDVRLRAKSECAQRTELLAKALSHNIRVLIQCKYQLGITLDFSDQPTPTENSNGQLGFAVDRFNYQPGINKA